jgi:hypothetical protein
VKYVLYAILIYLAYQFIFKLVIPVYMASRKIKQGFREMQEKMQQQQSGYDQGRQHQGSDPQSSAPKAGPKANPGDYIEFEEVK